MMLAALGRSVAELALAMAGFAAMAAAVRPPVFSVRNICILAVAGSTFTGWLLLPTAMDVGGWQPPDRGLLDRIEAMVVLGSLGSLLLFGGTIVVLDRMRGSGAPLAQARAPLFSWPDAVRPALLVVSFVLLMACSVAIVAVYWITDYVPWCQPQDPAAKYFEGATARYVPVRPMYIAATNILPVVNAAALFAAWEARRSRRLGWAVGFGALAGTGLIVMASTLKRGELFFPLLVVLVALLMARRLKLPGLVLGLALLFAASVALDPRSSIRILGAELCGVVGADQAVGPSTRPGGASAVRREAVDRLTVWQIIANNFAVEMRETIRLLYVFHDRELPLLWGRTYLAVPLVLVPSALSPLKREFELGRLTLRWWGNDPDRTSGPRVLGLSEAYINFGWAGAALFPIVVGAMVWALDRLQRRWWCRVEEAESVAVAAGFFVAAYAGLGFYLNGSPALQTLVIRAVGVVFVALPLFVWVRFPHGGRAQHRRQVATLE